MFPLTRRRTKELVFLGILLLALNSFGVFTHIFERNFYTDFHYPYDGDIQEAVQQLRSNVTPKIKPINLYNFKYLKNASHKCRDVSSLRLVYLVKSAPQHFERRVAIRSSWGFEHRFSDVEIRTVFLLGLSSAQLQYSINEESQRFNDIIQANFSDSYYNNTYKTMMGFTWVAKFCSNSRFYMFVDDDYYVSTRNVLRFIRNPTNYPKYLKQTPLEHFRKKSRSLQQFDFDLDDNVRLYSGYAFESSPHRHFISKWYVTLNEYPYHMWPPYVTAGAIVLSKEALLDMYYASFFTNHFRFDDIYVALLAFKAKIEPYHCDEFYFYKLDYWPQNYKYCIASHGYGDPDELLKVWTEQRSSGNA